MWRGIALIAILLGACTTAPRGVQISSGKIPPATYRMVDITPSCPDILPDFKAALDSLGMRKVERDAAGNFVITCMTRPANIVVGDAELNKSKYRKAQQFSQVELVVLNSAGSVAASSSASLYHAKDVTVFSELAAEAISNLIFESSL